MGASDTYAIEPAAPLVGSEPGVGTETATRFSGVEELEAAAREFGWNIDYRQLARGAFSAYLTGLECGGISLVTEHFDNHLHVHAEPPEGSLGLFLPCLDEGAGSAFGRRLDAADILVFPARSELELVSSGRIRNETVFLMEADFHAAARSIVPSMTLTSPGSASVRRGDPKELAAIRRAIGAVHNNGAFDSELASTLLARILLWMSDAALIQRDEIPAHARAAFVARRAQEYIEEGFRFPIRTEDLCAYAGVSLRTLQRSFSAQFQVSPLQYIKARRLNAARRDLVAACPSGATVTQIAMRSGYTHLGRFSVNYRECFGESPRQTIATARARRRGHVRR